MNQPKILIKYYSSASLLAHIFIPILCLHVLPRKDALLELEINAILTENFREELAFYLLDELIDGVSKGKISLVCGMSMQIEIHEQSLVLVVVFAELTHCKARRLLLRVGS